MSALQYIYTSTKKGYGVYSKSIGLNLDECKQITINTRYVRPQELASNASLDLSKFPIKLSKFKLRNQKWCIAQSVYLGKDNTGRQGNYFTHGLVFGKNEVIKNGYLDYQFKTKLTETEFENVSPAPLSEVSSLPLFNVSMYIDFVKDKQKALARLVDIFLDSQRRKKKTIIIDTNENTIKWIKALLVILPQKLMKDIEFSSYVERITSSFDIVGIYKEDFRQDGRLNIFRPSDMEEPSEFALNIVKDFVMNSVKREFLLMANSLSKKELLSRIEQLYDVFSSDSVMQDEFFEIVNSLPTTDDEIVFEVVNFILENNYSLGISLANFKVLQKFTEMIKNDDKYYSLIHSCAANGTLEVVDAILNDNFIYSDTFVEFNKSLSDYNDQYRMFSIKVYLIMIKKKFSVEMLNQIKNLSSSFEEDRVQELREIMIELLKIVVRGYVEDPLLEVDPLNILIELTNKYLSVDEIKHYASRVLLTEINRIDKKINVSISKNTIAILFSLNGLKDIRKALMPIANKRRLKDLNMLLSIVHEYIDDQRFGNISVKEVEKSLYNLFRFVFDNNSRGKQKEFKYKYYKLKKFTYLALKPNYIFIFSSIFIAITSTFVGGIKFIETRYPQILEKEDAKFEYNVYEVETLNEERLLSQFQVKDFLKSYNDLTKENDLLIAFSIDIQEVNVGKNNVILYVTDKNGNKSQHDFKLIINDDTTNPIIEFQVFTYKYELGFVCKDNIESILKQENNKVTITDNSFNGEFELPFGANHRTENFEVTYNYDYIKFDSPGVYDIYVTVTDNYGNELPEKIKVTLEDTVKPQITSIVKEITVEIGQEPIYDDIYKFIDHDVDTKPNIDDSKLNTDLVGVYPVTISFSDTSGNTSEEVEVTVTVEPKSEVINE